MSIILIDFNSFNSPFCILPYRHVIYNYAILDIVLRNFFYINSFLISDFKVIGKYVMK